MKSKQTLRLGSLIEIPLGDLRAGYGQVVSRTEVAFFDFFTNRGDDVDARLITGRPVLFTIPVMNSAIKSGRWPVIGAAPVVQLDARHYFVQDKITRQLFLYQAASGEMRPASFDEVQGLESAAVWDAEHVEDRLRDHLAGRPNKWVEQMKPVAPTSP